MAFVTTSVDASDGRIYLPKKLREKFGEEFEIIEMDDRLMLLPVPEDPLDRLREITEETADSADQLKEDAREFMMEEADR